MPYETGGTGSQMNSPAASATGRLTPPMDRMRRDAIAPVAIDPPAHPGMRAVKEVRLHRAPPAHLNGALPQNPG